MLMARQYNIKHAKKLMIYNILSSRDDDISSNHALIIIIYCTVSDNLIMFLINFVIIPTMIVVYHTV